MLVVPRGVRKTLLTFLRPRHAGGMSPDPLQNRTLELVFEPDLQAWPASLERETGIEPATNSLEGCDSTTELLPLNEKHWSR